jgi:large subunit ribosomal protein L7/L12
MDREVSVGVESNLTMSQCRQSCKRAILDRRWSSSPATRSSSRSPFSTLVGEPAAAADTTASLPLSLLEVPPPIKWTTHRLSVEQITKVDAIFHKILWLDSIETSLLTESINQKLGLKLTPKQRAALQRQIERGDNPASVSTSSVPATAEEVAPKTVDLKLTGFDASSKIKVIKEVRSIAGLGLKEAKELVEGAPTMIQKDLKPEQAEELKAKLEAAGATVELV